MKVLKCVALLVVAMSALSFRAANADEPDGSFNEEYCKWCYTDGRFAYSSMEQLIDYLAEHFSGQDRSPEEVRTYFSQLLPSLSHWKEN